MQVGLEQPEGLEGGLAGAAANKTRYPEAHQKRAVDRLLAQVYYELLQGHGLVVDGDEQVA